MKNHIHIFFNKTITFSIDGEVISRDNFLYSSKLSYVIVSKNGFCEVSQPNGFSLFFNVNDIVSICNYSTD